MWYATLTFRLTPGVSLSDPAITLPGDGSGVKLVSLAVPPAHMLTGDGGVGGGGSGQFTRRLAASAVTPLAAVADGDDDDTVAASHDPQMVAEALAHVRCAPARWSHTHTCTHTFTIAPPVCSTCACPPRRWRMLPRCACVPRAWQ